MKPIPASATQRPTWSGVRSILTPREASTSAAPDRDDSARLPCLATGTPAPATMKEAQVDTLTEPEPSPPVPTTSIASAGALTCSILARIAETAPVISSTVSPRTRKAISNPPIWEGVASPDIMLSKADAASSRDKVAPVATFPIIALRSSIACFRTLVVCAGHLREGGLVDCGANVAFQFGDVLRNLFIRHTALECLFQLLDVVRGEIDRRQGHVRHAKHDPLVGRRPGSLADTILGGAKRRGDCAAGHARQTGVAANASNGLHFQSGARSFIGELAPLLQLLNHFGRLCLEPAGDLVLAPPRLDLVLDLVEVALA